MGKSTKKPFKDLIINNNPKSAFAEAIKSIKTNIQFSSINGDFKIILLTSPAPGDGKSFVSANLAAAFAQEDKKVLIIDADLRRGRQHKIFNIKSDTNQSYSNLIVYAKRTSEKKINFKQFIHKTYITNLSLLPAGPVPPNPLELLSSETNKEIISALRNSYDIIIIDCPPVIGLSDAIVLSKLSDINLICVTSGRTKYEQLSKAKEAFTKTNSKLHGVILNRVNTKGHSYSTYYADKYYTDGYYSDEPESGEDNNYVKAKSNHKHKTKKGQ